MTITKETIIYKKITSRIYDDGKPPCRHKVEEEEFDNDLKNASYASYMRVSKDWWNAPYRIDEKARKNNVS